MSDYSPDSLVVYKNRPARVLTQGEKIELDLGAGKTQRVRPKDILPLHPGPVKTLRDLGPCSGDVEEAWSLLEGEETALSEVAELAFGAFTPATAWATWELAAAGVYFESTPGGVRARSREEVEREQREQEAAAREAAEWAAFLERLRQGTCAPEDGPRLTDVVALADGRAERSRVLRELGREATPENAHRLLLKVGYWGPEHNPHPFRFGLSLREPDLEVPPLPAEERLDLTAMGAYAIDDEGNEDPDDALSWDGERLWVHVADVAALVRPGSPLDQAARERGANLYLPDRTVNMLPAAVTARLGLGLQEVSPALSFALTFGADGAISHVDLHPSWIRVTRLSYEVVDGRLEEEPFATFAALAERHLERRLARGATQIDLPEVRIRVAEDGRVSIRPLERNRARTLVTEAMLMTGEAVARFAQERVVPFPYTTQPPPDGLPKGEGLANMYARRRHMKRSQKRASAEPHAGLGLEVYAQATSPLRRYLDLSLHQQLRAWLAGETVLDVEEMLARVGEIDLLSGQVRKAERQSNLHWTLVYLVQNPDWQGQGVVVEHRERFSVALIPELAFEARIRGGPWELNTPLSLRCTGVDLPGLSAKFQVVAA